MSIWWGHKRPKKTPKPEFELVYQYNEWLVRPLHETRENRKRAKSLEASVKELDGK